MKILVVGDETQFKECRAKLGQHSFAHQLTLKDARAILPENEIIFHFPMDDPIGAFGVYTDQSVPVFMNTCKVTLAELASKATGKARCSLFGFNGLPTQFNRQFLEVSVLKKDDEPLLAKICAQLNTGYLLVDDRVGLVTPRVICMIINEAYFTVQEGTATREDIDLAMKLGTNYPYGPFEWCKRIGLKHVYELLEAIYDDTKDERYRISALMKREYVSGQW